jgi:membrane protein implicated in regulation of membrane protease activity
MREQVVAALLDELVLLLAVGAIAAALAVLVGFRWYLLLPLVAVIAFLVLLLVKGVEAQLRRPVVGIEALVGKHGRVVETPGADTVVVLVEGELWKARCRVKGCRLSRGVEVRVVGYEGLTLLVEPATPSYEGQGSAKS